MTQARPGRGTLAGRERLAFSLAIFVLALTVRGLVLWQLSGSALFDVRMGDGRVYDTWARGIAAGSWLGDETFYQAPLYPYFLAVVYRTLGDSMLAVRVVQSLLGAAACAFLVQAGWRFFSHRAGIVAGAMLALYAPAFFADAMIQKSVLDIFFVCLALWIMGELVERPRPGLSLVLGSLLGLLVLTRENAMVFAVVLVPWLYLQAPGGGEGSASRAGVARALAFLAGALIVLTPVAARNAYVGGELHLTTSQLGHNLFIGNNENADGTYAPLIPGRGDPRIERQDAIDLAEMASGRKLTPSEVSGFWADRALDYIRSQPGDWLLLMGRKVVLVFTSVEVVDTEDQYTHAESSWLLRFAGRLFHFGVLAPLALLGAIVAWPQRARWWPLAALLAVYTAAMLLFYVFARYRLPLVPILVLFAATGLVGLSGFVRGSSRGRVAAALAATAALAVFCHWPSYDVDYMRSVTHYNLGNELMAREREDEAIHHYREAMRLHAGNALATHNLGVVMAGRGDLALAGELYRQALVIDPDYVDAHFNLARTHAALGETDLAIERYRSGLEQAPRRADVWLELAGVQLATGDPAGAVECFERALVIDPGLNRARRGLEQARVASSAGEDAAGPPPPAD